MTYWNSRTQVSEFRKARFELVKTTKLLFRNTDFGDQVYEVMDHKFIRKQALQPQVKTITLVQENDLKYLLIKKLISSYLIGDFISSTLDVESRTYEVEFSDGQMAELAANVIARICTPCVTLKGINTCFYKAWLTIGRKNLQSTA